MVGDSGYAAIVLAGGSARRMGGVLKPARTVTGVPLLTRVLTAVAGADPVIVVGPPSLRPLLPEQVLLTREEPPGGGPVAATAAGLELVPPERALVALLAADLPFLTAGAIDQLTNAVQDGAVLVDGDHRPQWLCGVWRVSALRGRTAAQREGSMRDLLAPLHVARVRAPDAWFDCDTEDDLRRAEEHDPRRVDPHHH